MDINPYKITFFPKEYSTDKKNKEKEKNKYAFPSNFE